MGRCLAVPQHTLQTLWIKRTMEAVGHHGVSLPAGWTAIKSPGSGGSAQLVRCALPTFVSGLLAGDRDDIKAGWGAADATGASSDSDLLPCPSAASSARQRPRRRRTFPVMRALLRSVSGALTNSTHRQANTRSGGKATAPMKQTVSLGGRHPVKATKRSSQTQPNGEECVFFFSFCVIVME